ncbi:MAG: hypothetical protein K0S09_848 [Sphingobacteriaceae bacterium]|jgi:uncharacterized protein YecE (DUF72 family)|nr:hypothetical protein [Sphingobacteriaceae bacterium]
MLNWNIGCSGFHYKHWKGIFYPEGLAQKKWFDYYCQFFNTLELNVTFYRFPQLSMMQNWHEKSPDNFRFAVKAPRAITHFKKFLGTVDMLSDFYNTCRDGLQEKLGCVLFQMPPRLGYSPEFLKRIINSLDNSFLNVVEFRNESWWRQDVYDELAKHNISFCGMSHPTLPKDVIANTGLLYYRFHGEDALYASLYSKEKLQETVKIIRGSDTVKDAFIFFNNDIHGYAVKNAREMIGMLK